MFTRWNNHNKECEVQCDSGNNISRPCPQVDSNYRLTNCDAPDVGCCSSPSFGCVVGEPINYALHLSYQQGLVSARQWDGMSWYTQDDDHTNTGSTSVSRDSMSAYSRTFTRDFAERLIKVEFRKNLNQDEAPLDFTWTSPTEIQWSRNGTATSATGRFKYDLYGRRRQVRTADPDQPSFDLVQVTESNGLGNLTCQGDWLRVPFNSDPACSGVTMVDYDPFGRPGQLLRGTEVQVGFAYNGLTSYRSNWVKIDPSAPEQEFVFTEVRDGFGRLRKVVEPGPADTLGTLRITTYEYDLMDRVTNVHMSIRDEPSIPSVDRWFTYDGHGNLRSEAHPESGTTLYLWYDPKGNVLQSRDANNVTIFREYDCAGRLRLEYEESQIGEYRQLWYDLASATNQQAYPGRFVGDWYHNKDGTIVAHERNFDGRGGRLSKHWTGIALPDQTTWQFQQDQSYNDIGLLSQVVNPWTGSDANPTRTILSVDAGYAQGHLKSLTRTTPAQNLVSRVLYDASGAVARYDFQNVPPSFIFTARAFDARNRISQITGTGSFDTGVYQYDRAGNIYGLGSDLFGHLAQGQLSTASVTTAAGLSELQYAYHHYDSMKSRLGFDDFEFTIGDTTNRISDTGYSYSDRGELKTTPTQAYEYDAFGSLTRVTDSLTDSLYHYDARGYRSLTQTAAGCRTGRALFIRDDAGRILSEFLPSPTCTEPKPGGGGTQPKLLWRRDYMYATSELIGTVAPVDGGLAKPFLQGTVVMLKPTACRSETFLDVAEPPSNLCGTVGVNLYIRYDQHYGYDFTAPLNPSPIVASCPTFARFRDYYHEPCAPTEPPCSCPDIFCYVARSVAPDGTLGPPSDEVCTFTMPQAPPDPPLPVGCPAPLPATAPAVAYYLNDHLGTPRVTVAQSGAVSATLKLGPFGEALEGANCQTRTFTGHERDSDTGLDYMMARYYSGTLGRFLSTDPVRNPNLANPQGWNAYAYALNNPLRYVDPDGRLAILDWVKDKWNTLFNKVEEKATVQVAPDTRSQEQKEAAAEVGEPDYKAAEQQVAKNAAGAVRVVAEQGAQMAIVGGINMTGKGLAHALERHTVGGAMTAGKSIFHAGEDVAALVKAGEGVAAVEQRGGNFARLVDAGRSIGIDRATGQATSAYTIITDRSGNLVTVFPGQP